jgi:hypothetical protein
MGTLFLPNKWTRHLFDLSVLLHFIAILVSYALAGSEAYGQLLGVNYVTLIAPFVIGCGIFVTVARRFIHRTITAFTAFKCVMLLLVIGAIGGLADEIDLHPTTDWGAVTEPFLIGTLALGGGS